MAISWLEKLKFWSRFSRRKTAIVPVDTSLTPEEEQTPWWGRFLVEEEQSRYFKISSVILCVDRYNQEWHITSYRNENNKPPFKSFSAFGSNEICLKPVLPDRPLLASLDRPLYLPSGKFLVFYLSSPLWISVEAGNPAVLLEEIQSEVLSDTWFGKNTLEGELCYSGRTYSSSRLEELPRDLTRVVSPIFIQNRSRTTLVLKELKIPLPFLSIYLDKQNGLWTEQVTFQKEEDAHPEIHIGKRAPEFLKSAQCLNHPRVHNKSGLINLFSPFRWS